MTAANGGGMTATKRDHTPTVDLASSRPRPPSYLGNDIALIDLLDRLLHGGVVVQGDIVLGVADIDLVKLDLRLLIASIDKVLGS